VKRQNPSLTGAVPAASVARLRAHLERLYAVEEAAWALERLVELGERFGERLADRSPRPELFDQTDVILITYADQISEPGRAPLATLRDFLKTRAGGVVTGVHLLPFYPSTSDDGFAVADFHAVDPAVGTWEDVEAFATDFRMMFDAVVNHVSSRNRWFLRWVAGEEDVQDFFLALQPDSRLASVTRPRATPLLTPVSSTRGTEHVWTTFSADQVDLNYGNPAVLVAMTEVLLTYLAHGADIIRLDAVAFLWKRIGTACVHLAETHEVIRLWRALFDWVAPGALLITETNVPHDENVSYFGSGHDEAHLVYQFPLAPLVLSAFHLADASTLRDWARGLHTPSDTTSFFNFLGSHDGVGLRPAEGLLTQSEIQQLCELSKAHGGGVSWKTNADGTLSPYELNSVYFDALTEADSPEPAEVQVARFLAAQSILLALAGVPGIYVQALLGSRNWHAGVERHGSLRSINRQKLDRATLEAELDTPGSLRNLVFNGFTERIRARIAQPAFHPNGPQRVLPSAPPLFVLERTAPDGSSTILCVHNVSGVRQRFRSTREDGLTVQGPLVDVLSGRREQVDRPGVVDLHVGPYEVLWLRGERT
jgi:glucosylglycerate phosphorylase